MLVLAAIIVLPLVLLREQVSQVLHGVRRIVTGAPGSEFGDETTPGPVTATERLERSRQVLRELNLPEPMVPSEERSLGNFLSVVTPSQLSPGGMQTAVLILFHDGSKQAQVSTREWFAETSEDMRDGQQSVESAMFLDRSAAEALEDYPLEEGELVTLAGAVEGAIAVGDPKSSSVQILPAASRYPMGIAYGIFVCGDLSFRASHRSAADRPSEQFSREELAGWVEGANSQARTAVLDMIQRASTGLVARNECPGPS
jgi:hypothetical protein